MKKAKPAYQVLELEQGTKEWLEERKKWVTASEMPSILGVAGAFRKRDFVLKEKVTGEAPPVSDWVQENLYNPGHAAEVPLREAAIKELGIDLAPAVVVNPKLGLLSSLDCVNFDEGVIVEAKLTSSPKVIEPAKVGRAFEPYRIQIMTQMMTTGFRRAYLFVMEAVTGTCYLVEVPYCEETAAQILAAKDAFLADVAAGRTGEIEINDTRMERLKRLLWKQKDILEEIKAPMELLDDLKAEIDHLKKAIAEEFPHNTILGMGVRITKSKPVESLDRAAIAAAGIDLKPFTKFNKPAVKATLVE